MFCADTMVNIEPTAEELAEIAFLAADTARFFDIEPRVALLSFSSFGSVRHPLAETGGQGSRDRPSRCARNWSSTARCTSTRPSSRRSSSDNYPHSRIRGDANVLVFPSLAAGNIGYKLVHRLGAPRPSARS